MIYWPSTSLSLRAFTEKHLCYVIVALVKWSVFWIVMLGIHRRKPFIEMARGKQKVGSYSLREILKPVLARTQPTKFPNHFYSASAEECISTGLRSRSIFVGKPRLRGWILPSLISDWSSIGWRRCDEKMSAKNGCIHPLKDHSYFVEEKHFADRVMDTVLFSPFQDLY